MNNIIIEAENFVSDLYANKISDVYKFHSKKHAQRLVKNAIMIANNSNIDGEQLEILTLAAWFQDTGLSKIYENHELVSAEIAREFLASHKYPEEKMEQVVACIKAKDHEGKPPGTLQKILRDADILHIGKKSYFKRDRELREEMEKIRKKDYNDLDWVRINIDFFHKHDFLTDYARRMFRKQRIINLSILEGKRQKLEGKKEDAHDPASNMIKNVKKVKTPDRGIETMFRVTSRNHFTLSSIADSKASTLISISALIISIIISVLIRRLGEQPELIIPTIIMLITLLGTIIFAVLATRPKVTSLNLSRDDIKKRQGNLLFFGNFLNMSVHDYEWGMQELMNDRDYLYNNLIRDIYYLGLVLGKKYRYLRIAYNFFMYGLIVSVIAYIIAFAL